MKKMKNRFIDVVAQIISLHSCTHLTCAKLWNKKTTFKQSYINFMLYLAWEPSVAKGSHSYSRRLPALGRKLLF